MSSNLSPRIVVLNGGSSSGKSSITRALQEMLPGIWLTFGVDTFIEALPNRGNSPRAGIAYSRTARSPSAPSIGRWNAVGTPD